MTIEFLINKLAGEFFTFIDKDIEFRHPVTRRGIIRKERSIICNVIPTLYGEPENLKLTARVGSWQQGFSYDDNYLSRFIEYFTNNSEYSNTLVKRITDQNSTTFVGDEFLAQLYVGLFCRKLIESYLPSRTITFEERQSLVCDFARDLKERGLGLMTLVGVNGIEVVKQFSVDSDSMSALLRPPKLDDISSPVIVPDRWEGELEIRNSPRLPEITSSIEITHSILKVRAGIGWMDFTTYDSNRVFDRFIEAMRTHVTRLYNLLVLYQSSQVPYFRLVEMRFYLKNLSASPIYFRKIPVDETNWSIPNPFVFRGASIEKFKPFWERMNKIDFMERIYGPSTESNSRLERLATPVEVAFTRYKSALAKDADYRIAIHDAVEALEGFFTPEKITSGKDYKQYHKIYIQRVAALFGIFERIDPNQTDLILQEAFKVRSDYSHRATGWDRTDPEALSGNQREIAVALWNSELDSNRDVSRISLNYLRICLNARILSGLSDEDFIKDLDFNEGRLELKNRLVGIEELIAGDPLVRIVNDTVKCTLCGRPIPSHIFPIHVDEDHQSEVIEAHHSVDFHSVLDEAFETFYEAVSKCKDDSSRVSVGCLEEYLNDKYPNFDSKQFFVQDMHEFIKLMGRGLVPCKGEPEKYEMP